MDRAVKAVLRSGLFGVSRRIWCVTNRCQGVGEILRLKGKRLECLACLFMSKNPFLLLAVP